MNRRTIYVDKPHTHLILSYVKLELMNHCAEAEPPVKLKPLDPPCFFSRTHTEPRFTVLAFYLLQCMASQEIES
jgi:hypothetical protein